MESTGIITQTSRLFLRPLQAGDLPALERVFGDPEVTRYGPGVQPPEWIAGWLREGQASYQTRGYGPWAVVERAGGALAGYCGLFYYPDVNGRPEVEIGYRLARACWGKGYATEAAGAVCSYAFGVLGLTRLVALIDPGNTASVRVAEKLGMLYEQDVMFEGYSHPDCVYVLEQRPGQGAGLK